MLKILVADDHALIRRGVKHILEEEFVPATVFEADTGQAALEAIKNHPFDLVVLDINFPDKNGLDLLKEINVLCPDLRIIILTLYLEEQYAVRALKTGASGYVTKDEPEELLLAVKKVLSGGTYVSHACSELLASRLVADNAIASYQALSDREFEVLRLLGQGKSLTQISDQMSLSIKTIGTYHARIKEKLSLESNAAIIQFAIDHGLVN